MADRPVAHRLNHGFEWRMPPAQGRLTLADRQQFDDLGFFVHRNAFDADQVASMIDAIDPTERSVEAFLERQDGGRLSIARAGEITFSIHLVIGSELLREMSMAPPILGLCGDLVGPNVRLYWDQAVYKKPGNPAEFPFHQDNAYTFVEPQQYLTCWIALTDTDETNGCPWVIPGWHRSGTLLHESTELGWRCVDTTSDAASTAIPVPARAGDIVVFSSLTPHRTGPNLTNNVRKSYILQYAPVGAAVIANEGDAPQPQDDPGRQYLVLSGGEPVAPT